MATEFPNEQEQAATRPHKDYYTALYQSALTIAASIELSQVLESVVRSTTDAMQVKACVLRLLDVNTGQLELSAVYGLSSDYLSKGPVKVNNSALDSEALCGKAVYVPDVRTDTRFQYRNAARQEGIVAALCVPLEVHGQYIGVMRVYTAEPTQFDEEDVQFMSVLASLAALAIENARLYESVKDSYNGVITAFWGASTSY